MRKLKEGSTYSTKTLNQLGQSLLKLADNNGKSMDDDTFNTITRVGDALTGIGERFHPKTLDELKKCWQRDAEEMTEEEGKQYLASNNRVLDFALKPAKKSLDESSLESNNSEEIAQAQTLLAAQDISDRLQKMAEQVGKMSIEDLMPLVDVMKRQYGPEVAQGFNDTVKSTLDELLNKTIEAKDATDNAVLTIQGGGCLLYTSDAADE